jgi:hypothetical protein
MDMPQEEVYTAMVTSVTMRPVNNLSDLIGGMCS